MKIVWSALAKQRRLEIIRYIAQYDIDAAKKMDMLLRSSAKSLLKFPRKGKAGKVEGTRELIITPRYVMVYTVSDSVIDIISVVHTSQLYPLS